MSVRVRPAAREGVPALFFIERWFFAQSDAPIVLAHGLASPRSVPAIQRQPRRRHR